MFKLFFIAVICTFSVSLFADDIVVEHSNYHKTELVFLTNEAKIEKLDFSDWPVKRETIQTFNGTLYEENGLRFFTFHESTDILFENFNLVKLNRFTEKSPILILSSRKFDFTLLIDSVTSNIINTVYSKSFYTDLGMISYHSTGYLTEGKTEYTPENLSIDSPNIPWVSRNSLGGKDIIGIECNRAFNKILISNGFVSAQKPYLYTANSRLEKIRVFDVETGIDFQYVLIDSPDFQVIDLPKDTKSISIEIESIYLGDKWPEDICLNIFTPLKEIP